MVYFSELSSILKLSKSLSQFSSVSASKISIYIKILLKFLRKECPELSYSDMIPRTSFYKLISDCGVKTIFLSFKGI